MQKVFNFEGTRFTLLASNEWFAVYSASQGPKILFYKMFNVTVHGNLDSKGYVQRRDYDAIMEIFNKVSQRKEGYEFSKK